MKKIMFQFALDGAYKKSKELAVKMINDVKDKVDIVEIGTSFIFRYGLSFVKEVKEMFPNIKILADMKIMDGGYYNALMGFEYGADVVTVLGVSDSETIIKSTNVAHSNNKKVMVDFLKVDDISGKLELCEKVGVDYICVHSGIDEQSKGIKPNDNLKNIINLVKKCKVAVAGGINETTLENICKLEPEIVIIGAAISNEENYAEIASNIRLILDKIERQL
ncbi:MAG: 3-hexulose-6-phosphate synthase [Erysipelotrichaceae bacterium]|jgi:3-hexulose-6-phosphate synthase